MNAEVPDLEFTASLAEHRTRLLRHCYRLLGSFADAEDLLQETLLRAWQARSSFAGEVPVLHWLMRIATNSCLTHLERRRRRHFPQLDRPSVTADAAFESLEATYWITPAPDADLFGGADNALVSLENVGLAFVALLQRVPPFQRAVLILKDVLGWTSEEIAQSLDQTVSSVNSALHRARDSVGKVAAPAPDPDPHVLREYIRCWEEQDLDGLVARLHADVAFAMPPYANWFRGSGALCTFLQQPPFAPFWTRGLAAWRTRANGGPALVWYAPGADELWQPHSIHLMQFEGDQLKEAINFIGKDYLVGFDLPAALSRDAISAWSR